MYYFIYETKNKINGKLYRGCHSTSTLDDGYIGSGIAIKRSIKKYGRDAFEMNIICFCFNLEEMISKEAEYVNEEWVSRKDTYNLQTGGLNYGILCEESKRKISKSISEAHARGVYENVNREYLPLKEEVKNKISETLKNRYKDIPHHTIGSTPWNKGKRGLQVAWNKGTGKEKPPKKERVAWNKNKKMPQEECIYCGKQTSLVNLKRWHNDNCKHRLTKKEKE
jgi:hypothetical protein